MKTVAVILISVLVSTVQAQESDHFTDMDVFGLEWVANPQISPDGGYVAYVRTSLDVMQDRKRSEIWIIESDGSDHRRVAAGSSPTWSPAGDKMAYVSDGQIHV